MTRLATYSPWGAMPVDHRPDDHDSAALPSQAHDRAEPAPDAPPASGAGLSDEALTILGLVAAHDGVSPRTFLTRAICTRAAQIGLQGLLTAFEIEAEWEACHANCDPDDLHEVPEFERSATRRFGRAAS